MELDHIGIAVKNLEESNELFTKLLGKSFYKIEEIESENVKTSFFKSGASKIELLESTNPNSTIAKFIKNKGEGIHHIAFNVQDINLEISRLKKQGFTPIIPTLKKGADNKLITFLHPKNTNSVLIELCQNIE